MEIKNSTTAGKPKLELAVNMARKKCHVFVDTSFAQKGEHKSGAGAIVTNPKRQEDITLIQAFDMADMDIDNSRHAELWGTTLILENLRNFNIEKLTFDCSYIGARIQDIMDDTLNEEKYNSALFERLRVAVKHQESMSLNCVERSDPHISLVDSFSRVATSDIASDQACVIAQQHHAPFLLFHMNSSAHIDRTTIFEAPEPIEGNHPT